MTSADTTSINWDDRYPTGMTTADVLGRYRRELIAAKVPDELADTIVLDVARTLHNTNGLRLHAPTE